MIEWDYINKVKRIDTVKIVPYYIYNIVSIYPNYHKERYTKFETINKFGTCKFKRDIQYKRNTITEILPYFDIGSFIFGEIVREVGKPVYSVKDILDIIYDSVELEEYLETTPINRPLFVNLYYHFSNVDDAWFDYDMTSLVRRVIDFGYKYNRTPKYYTEKEYHIVEEILDLFKIFKDEETWKHPLHAENKINETMNQIDKLLVIITDKRNKNE